MITVPSTMCIQIDFPRSTFLCSCIVGGEARRASLTLFNAALNYDDDNTHVGRCHDKLSSCDQALVYDSGVVARCVWLSGIYISWIAILRVAFSRSGMLRERAPSYPARTAMCCMRSLTEWYLLLETTNTNFFCTHCVDLVNIPTASTSQTRCSFTCHLMTLGLDVTQRREDWIQPPRITAVTGSSSRQGLDRKAVRLGLLTGLICIIVLSRVLLVVYTLVAIG
ncbi:hypothetical protein NEOLEDRAFT_1246649 [Neolentinus lepideus HHB14362 ss-1]|uniref:Uncharacterized protein n=1 Tax=Neolentinus lepideus HHB14362 ss-1 TaxID=1314782 RepID=A0A165LKV1_9AGAM|nr:hypothetical protein NEOLEDRAFT_1246649 [Neolentinus lepideus HHB14362 ss-1]